MVVHQQPSEEINLSSILLDEPYTIRRTLHEAFSLYKHTHSWKITEPLTHLKNGMFLIETDSYSTKMPKVFFIRTADEHCQVEHRVMKITN
jgi:hypothetical protein